MTKAEQTKTALVHKNMTFTELLIEAEEIAEAYEQDYENELSWFEYADGSIVCFDGKLGDIRTYGGK
jgi:S-adenosylmethionine:tRNA-ribosyltransferase-isomerase (queuine synthetase)